MAKNWGSETKENILLVIQEFDTQRSEPYDRKNVIIIIKQG